MGPVRTGKKCESLRVKTAAAIFMALAVLSQATYAVQCIEIDNGDGTVALPALCDYATEPEKPMLISFATIPGSDISIDALLNQFYNILRRPGGTLGGEVVSFQAIMSLNMSGTGSLATFNRLISMPVTGEIHTGPRHPGDPVQTFDTEMVSLQGEIHGDLSFEQLRITAGSRAALPSPGRTTLTMLGDSTFNVDSFFDITYRIDFVGAPGSTLEGLSGSTTGTSGIQQGEPAPENTGCTAPGNGLGTADLPAQCDIVSFSGPMVVTEGLFGRGTMQLLPVLTNHRNVARVGGGSLCGEIERFDSTLQLEVSGTGELAGFNRMLTLPVSVEVHTGPRNPGDAAATVETEIVALQLKGAAMGDPDFAELSIFAGRNFGLPSPGQTTLTKLSGDGFAVDSFFDIEYRIDFVGAPDSALEGMGGTTYGHGTVGNGRQPAHDLYFGLPNTALGEVNLESSLGGDLVVSNIGSSGEDGVAIDLGQGVEGFSFVADFGQAGDLAPGGTFNIDSFFDVTYEINFTDTGRGILSVLPKGCSPKAVYVQLLRDGQVVDSKGFAETLPDDLVVSNIGSSGEDGVSFSLREGRRGERRVDSFFDVHTEVDSFFDVFTELTVDSFFDVFFDITVTDVDDRAAISGNSPVAADQIRLISRVCGCSCMPPDLLSLRAANIGSFGIHDQALEVFGRPHRALGQSRISSNRNGQLVVSNIGSSGEDGVWIDIDRTNFESGGFFVDSFFDVFFSIEIKEGRIASLQGGDSFAVDSFFDITYELEPTSTPGQLALNLDAGTSASLVTNVRVEGLAAQEHLYVENYRQVTDVPLTLLKIGSSGEDGVMTRVGMRENPDGTVDSFFDVFTELSTDDRRKDLADIPDQIRLIVTAADGPMPQTKASIGLRASGIADFAIENEPACGDHGYMPGDLNFDCRINMHDFRIVGEAWLGCNDPSDTRCF